MALHIEIFTAPPATTPTGIGQHGIDITNRMAYISVGTATAADWIPTNSTPGIYTPTAANNVNLDANPVPTQAQYSRTGNVVTVSGRFSANPTAAATPTSFSLTLPIASNLGAVEDLAGMAVSGAMAGMSAEIIGDVAGNFATVQWISTDIAVQNWSFIFQYRIIP